MHSVAEIPRLTRFEAEGERCAFCGKGSVDMFCDDDCEEAFDLREWHNEQCAGIMQDFNALITLIRENCQ